MMARQINPSAVALRVGASHQDLSSSVHLVPFGPYGAGKWTSHPIGWVITVGFVLMGLVGVPEARPFFLLSLIFGGVLGRILWTWHRSKGFSQPREWTVLEKL
jgi:hypothetical protein